MGLQWNLVADDSPEAARDGPVLAEPVRVMHLVYRLQSGGMEHGVIKICNGLDRGRVQSSVCSTTPATDVKWLLRPEVPLFECHRRQGNDPRLVVELFRLFRRERPHIVHTHSWGTLVEGVLAARLARVPKVIHGEHGTMELRPLQVQIQRFVWSRTDRVLSVSSRLAERMASVTGFPRERITTIRNGVDTSAFGQVSRHAARVTLGLSADDLIVGTIGRLVPVKGHAMLIDAVAKLRDRGRLVTAVIAGDGPLEADLKARVKALMLQDRLLLLGHRPDTETVLAALDVFVLPSRSEGLSNTILEAMASGLPVVATAVGGNDELIDQWTTGVLVAPEDADAFATAIEELLASNDKRAAIGSAALGHVRSAFSIEAMIQHYEQVYLDCWRAVPGRRSSQ
jgi:sugar transferase (PEP-CTERM/EpsH1 system associated)